MMIGQNNTVKLWAALAALAALLLGAGVWPNLHSTASLRARSGDLRVRASRADDGEAMLNRLQERLDGARRDAVTVAKPIPQDGDVAGLISAMSAELQSLGLGKPEIATGQVYDAEDAAALPMTVDLSGPAPAILDAVRWIEGLPRLVRVRKVRLELPEQGNSPAFGGPVEAELTLDVYFAPTAPSLRIDAVADVSEDDQ